MNAYTGKIPQALASLLPEGLLPESAQTAIYYVGLAFLCFLLLYGLVMLLKLLFVDLPKKRKITEAENAEASSSNGTASTDDAAIAAAIAASIVVTEDQALTAAITAAVAVYLEMENGGKSSLPTGFRVVSFKRRHTGAWNRNSK